MRSAATLRGAALILGAVLLATGCAGGEPGPSTDGSSGSPKPTATPKPTVDPAAYKQSLGLTLSPVNQSLSAVAAARGLPALGTTIAAAQAAIGKAAQDLEAIKAPDDALAEHSKLIQAFAELSADLGGVSDAVKDKQLCAPSSVLSQLGKARGMTSTPAAAKALTAKGYPIDIAVPKTPPMQTRRLPNGDYLRKANTSGRGSLTISNGTDTDTVITLAKGTSPASVVYVRANGSHQIKGIRDATYTVFYSTGQDWDAATRSFTRQCGFKKFDKTLAFTTSRRGNLIYYSQFSLTLQPVIGGNATTTEVDPKDFPVQ